MNCMTPGKRAFGCKSDNALSTWRECAGNLWQFRAVWHSHRAGTNNKNDMGE